MKKFFAMFFMAALIFSAVSSTVGAAEPGKKLRVLGIGNSFTVNSTKYLPQIVKSDGVNADICVAQIGGSPLNLHLSLLELGEKNPDDPKAKRYHYYQKGKFGKVKQVLNQILQDGKWDIITIQQVSWKSIDPKTYRPYAKKVLEYIKKYQPDAKVFVNETWAYEYNSSRLKKWKMTQQQMYDKLHAAYTGITKELGLPLIPVGTAFNNARKFPMWQFKLPEGFDPKAVKYPEKLPDCSASLAVGYGWRNSKKDKNVKVAHSDPHHAGVNGEYLAGLVWYEVLFGKDAREITYKPKKISEERAKSLREVAHATVKQIKEGK